uniref:Uncharacterized protein n=1 Tax=Oryza punctata TaxID=4537 RepID=A0A0E0MEM2_ORYPU
MVTVDPRTSDASNSKGNSQFGSQKSTERNDAPYLERKKQIMLMEIWCCCLAFDVSNVLVEPDIHDIFARIPGYGFVHTFYTQIPDLLQWKSTARKLFDVLNEVVVDRGSNPYLSKIECYEHNHLITKIPDGARSNAWVSFDGKRRQQLSRGYSVQISMSQLPLPNVNESDQTGDFHSLIRCLNWKERLDQKTLYRLVLPCTCIALHIDTPFNRCHAQQWLINIQLHDY